MVTGIVVALLSIDANTFFLSLFFMNKNKKHLYENKHRTGRDVCFLLGDLAFRRP